MSYSINKLPVEILHYTFCFLPEQMFIRTIPLICRKWHSIMQKELFWNSYANSRYLLEDESSWKKTSRRYIRLNDPFHRIKPKICSIPSNGKWHLVSQAQDFTAIITRCSYHTYNTKMKRVIHLLSPKHEHYMSLSAYQNKVACGTNIGTVRLFNDRHSERLLIDYKIRKCIQPILWNESNLFACSYNFYVDQWNAETGQKVHRLIDGVPRNVQMISSLSADTLITSKNANFLTIWDIRQPTPACTRRTIDGRNIKNVVSVPLRQRIYTITDSQIKQGTPASPSIDFWDLRKLSDPISTMTTIELKKTHSPLTLGASLNYLFVGGTNQKLLIYNSERGDLVKAKISINRTISSMDVLQTTLVATSDASKKLMTIDL